MKIFKEEKDLVATVVVAITITIVTVMIVMIVLIVSSVLAGRVINHHHPLCLSMISMIYHRMKMGHTMMTIIAIRIRK